FTPQRNSQSASFVSCTGAPMRKAPAMLHRTSTRPKRSSAFSTAERTLSGFKRSASRTKRLSLSCRLPLFRSRRTRLAPRSAKALATARPRFPEAPVTITVRLSDRISLPRMVGARAAADDSVLRQHFARLEVRLAPYRFVNRPEIDALELEQLIEAAQHEVGLLEVVDAVARAHHARQVEAHRS